MRARPHQGQPTASGGHGGDSAYFKRLFAAIEGPELPALLHDLLRLDLTGFEHRTAPHTHALNRQKLVGGDSFGKFWLDCLTNGEIVLTVQEAPRATDVSGSYEDGLLDDGWPNDIVCQVFHHRYVEHAKRHGERHPITDAEVGKKGGCAPDRLSGYAIPLEVGQRQAPGGHHHPSYHIRTRLERHWHNRTMTQPTALDTAQTTGTPKPSVFPVLKRRTSISRTSGRATAPMERCGPGYREQILLEMIRAPGRSHPRVVRAPPRILLCPECVPRPGESRRKSGKEPADR